MAGHRRSAESCRTGSVVELEDSRMDQYEDDSDEDLDKAKAAEKADWEQKVS